MNQNLPNFEIDVAKYTYIRMASLRRLFAFGLLLVLVSTGCRTADTIAALEMPPQYRASAEMHRKSDLSQLAVESYNNLAVYPGDLLNITVVTGIEEKQPEPLAIQVSEDGEASLPVIGPVRIAGLRFDQAEQAIRTAAIERRYYANPTVSVTLESRQMYRVQVVGAVNKQGYVELPRAGADVLSAISMAEGLADDAGPKIEVKQFGLESGAGGGVQPVGYFAAEGTPSQLTEKVMELDLNDLEGSGADVDLKLTDGAVVTVHPEKPRMVYVRGLVREAGEYELPSDEPARVTTAIALAKGLTTEIADKVHLTRYVPGREEPLVIEVSLREANQERLANPVLQPGDEVYVLETPTTFTVEFLRQFFRFGFSSSFPGL